MIIYSITFAIDNSIENEWIDHMSSTHMLFSNDLECPRNKSGFCDLCDEWFVKDYLPVHLRVHHRLTEGTTLVLVCDDCDTKMASKTSLLGHVKLVHGEERMEVFICDCCGQAFHKRINLRIHMRLYRPPRKASTRFPCVCDLYGERSADKVHLKAHLRFHLRAAIPVVCDVCQFNCANNSDLYRHVRRMGHSASATAIS